MMQCILLKNLVEIIITFLINNGKSAYGGLPIIYSASCGTRFSHYLYYLHLNEAQTVSDASCAQILRYRYGRHYIFVFVIIHQLSKPHMRYLELILGVFACVFCCFTVGFVETAAACFIAFTCTVSMNFD